MRQKGMDIRDMKEAVLDRLQGEHLIRFVATLGVSPKRSGAGEYKIICPFHNDHSPSFGINCTKFRGGAFVCFSCHWKGDVFKFVSDLRGLSNFVDCVKWIAGHLGIADVGTIKEGKAPVKRDVDRSEPMAAVMETEEVLAVYKQYREKALDPAPWCEKLGIEAESMRMCGAIVANSLTSPDRTVLVMPMRDPLGGLISLRFRCFATKKRWSVDMKERRDSKWVQVKASRSGLMTSAEFFDEDICLDGTRTIVVEGETDLLAGVTMMIRSYGPETAEWPARWVGLPGCGACHEMLLDTRTGPFVLTFLDSDDAGKAAVFNHPRMRVVQKGEERLLTPDLTAPRVPGLLQKLRDRRKTALAAFPPRLEGEKKFDLRDMVKAGWSYRRFIEHCMNHATADVTGRSWKEVNINKEKP